MRFHSRIVAERRLNHRARDKISVRVIGIRAWPFESNDIVGVFETLVESQFIAHLHHDDVCRCEGDRHPDDIENRRCGETLEETEEVLEKHNSEFF